MHAPDRGALFKCERLELRIHFFKNRTSAAPQPSAGDAHDKQRHVKTKDLGKILKKYE